MWCVPFNTNEISQLKHEKKQMSQRTFANARHHGVYKYFLTKLVNTTFQMPDK